MGADMVGYLVVGPRKITKAQRKRAIAKVKKLARAVEAGKPALCGDCHIAYSEDSLASGRCDQCGALVPDFAAMKAPARYVDRLILMWPPNNRDTCSRYALGGKKIIVFAGDMSWGDAPEGGGYQVLQTLLCSGVAEELGLE